jgi:multicomponent Na+:H+ antiporter subunit D
VLLALALLIPLTAAGLMLAVRRSLRFQRALAAAASGALFVVGLALVVQVWRDGIHVLHVGAWPAPFGITLVADLLSASMVAITGVLAVAVVPYAFVSIDPARERYGFHPLIQVLLTGVCGAFLTGDLFNLYVWFEVMLMASFVLMALNGGRLQVEAATKYVVLNLVASAMFLAAVGLLYGLAGTVNMAHLSERLMVAGSPGLQLGVAALLFTAFGIKAAVFPLFFWLPASYHVAPAAVAAIFAGLLTKVGVYALIRVFTLVFAAYVTTWSGLFVVVAGFTMVTGVLGALAQDDMRRVLAFHIVSQIGYMLLGLAIATPLALAGGIFYILHHIIVKTNLFLVAGVVQYLGGTARLKSLGGLYLAAPLLAFLFLIPAMSLAGMPPLSGFVAKFAVIRAAIAAEHWGVGAVALVVGILTLLSMTKIWNEAFWKPRPSVGAVANAALRTRPPALMMAPIAFLAAITIAISFGAGTVFELATRAAEQLLEPRTYVRAVLGGQS